MPGTTTTTVTTTTTSTSTTTTTISPSSFKIAYTVYDAAGKNPDIWIINLDGTGTTELTTGGKSSNPEFTPDKTKIIFISSEATTQIYSMNVDGSAKTNLSNNSSSELETSITPDGTKIYFASTADGYFRTWKMDLNGSNRSLITAFGTDTWGPEVLPNGQKILVNSDIASGQTNHEDVFIIDMDGSNPLRLTSAEGTYNNYYPFISKDSSKFVYFSQQGGNSELFLMNIDGTGKTNLSNHGYASSNGEASFSYDSTSVVFQSNRVSSTFQVYKVGVDGTGLTALTSSGQNYKPQYLPNGQILFISERDGKPQLYVMDADGSNQTRISDITKYIGDAIATDPEKPSF